MLALFYHSAFLYFSSGIHIIACIVYSQQGCPSINGLLLKGVKLIFVYSQYITQCYKIRTVCIGERETTISTIVIAQTLTTRQSWV